MCSDDGVPLRHYRDKHPGSGILVYCRCGSYKRVELDIAIKALGEGFDVTKVWRKARERCVACGLVQWLESRPDLPKPKRWTDESGD